MHISRSKGENVMLCFLFSLELLDYGSFTPEDLVELLIMEYTLGMLKKKISKLMS